ncbi:MAG: hypothetical protein ACREJ3_08315, partial [Polyangiaceae bacterium]
MDDAVIDMTSPNALPRAFHFESLDGGAQLLALRIAGFLGTALTANPVLARIASTRFVSGATRDWTLRLDPRCLSGDPYHTFGGPICAAPQTCIAGRCADSYTAPEDLLATSDGGAAADPCAQGPADVILGSGANGFAPLHDGDVLQLETGTQGGHHIWLALRLRGFPQHATTVQIAGEQTDGGASVPTELVRFTLDPDSGGYCRLTNLRFQLDADGTDYHVFLGQPLSIHVDVGGANG